TAPDAAITSPASLRPRSSSAVPKTRSRAQYAATIGRAYPTGPTTPRTATWSNRPNGPPARNHRPRTESTASTTSPTPRASAARGVRWRATLVRADFSRARSPRLAPARPRVGARRLRLRFDEDRFDGTLPGTSLHLHDHGHDNRLSLRNLEKVPPEIPPDALFDHRLIGHFVVRARL